MGGFLASSAVRDRPVKKVASQIQSCVSKHGVACKPVTSGPVVDATDVRIFAPTNSWTVVLWPEYFNIHDIEVCKELSAALRTTISTVHVYDGDYWTHVLLRDGEALDHFASMPNYFDEEDGEDGDEAEPHGAARARKWAGDASVVAKALSLPSPDAITPYFVSVDEDTDDEKAFPEDEFELSDFWVFTDFWRKTGVAYPPDVAAYGARLRLGKNFAQKLPTSNEL